MNSILEAREESEVGKDGEEGAWECACGGTDADVTEPCP